MLDFKRSSLTDSQASRLVVGQPELNSAYSSGRRVPYVEWYQQTAGALETPAQRLQRDASDPQPIVNPGSDS